jgi:hypothetical protein
MAQNLHEFNRTQQLARMMASAEHLLDAIAEVLETASSPAVKVRVIGSLLRERRHE